MGRHSSQLTAYHPHHYHDKATKTSFPSKYEPATAPPGAESKLVESSVKPIGYEGYAKAEIRTHSEYTNQPGKRCFLQACFSDMHMCFIGLSFIFFLN